MNKEKFEIPDPKQVIHEEVAMSYSPMHAQSSTDAVKRKREAALMNIEGVQGVGLGQDSIGNEAIVVYVRDQGVAKQIPRDLDGVSVIVEVTGVIRPLPR